MWVAALIVVIVAGPRRLMRVGNPAVEAALAPPARATEEAFAMDAE
jgi:hypothetical protein